jgi:capsule polysaccharide export protein KpsE/RkpR
MTEQIKKKLTQLEELDAQYEIIRLDKQAAIDAVLTDEIKAQLAAIDAEFDPMSSAVQETIGKLEAEVKVAVLSYGETVKAAKYKAIFGNGRVSWDTKGLDGFRVAHPEIEAFRKVGSPSVSIRRG